MLWCMISDIHGNALALKAVLREAKACGADGIIGLGDYFGECGQSEKVMEILLEYEAILVMGNREEAALRLWRGQAPEMEGNLQLRCVCLAAAAVRPAFGAMVGMLPMMRSLDLGGCIGLMAHGEPGHTRRLIYPADTPQMESILTAMDEDIFANGHTHVSWKHILKDKLGFNPGSVGLSHDGVPGHASYALLETGSEGPRVTLMKTPYDVAALERIMVRSGWMEEAGIMARLALLEVKTGRKQIFPFVRYAYDHYEKAAGVRDGIIPDEIWLEAAELWEQERGRDEGLNTGG